MVDIEKGIKAYSKGRPCRVYEKRRHARIPREANRAMALSKGATSYDEMTNLSEGHACEARRSFSAV